MLNVLSYVISQNVKLELLECFQVMNWKELGITYTIVNEELVRKLRGSSNQCHANQSSGCSSRDAHLTLAECKWRTSSLKASCSVSTHLLVAVKRVWHNCSQTEINVFFFFIDKTVLLLQIVKHSYFYPQILSDYQKTCGLMLSSKM